MIVDISIGSRMLWRRGYFGKREENERVDHSLMEIGLEMGKGSILSKLMHGTVMTLVPLSRIGAHDAILRCIQLTSQYAARPLF